MRQIDGDVARVVAAAHDEHASSLQGCALVMGGVHPRNADGVEGPRQPLGHVRTMVHARGDHEMRRAVDDDGITTANRDGPAAIAADHVRHLRAQPDVRQTTKVLRVSLQMRQKLLRVGELRSVPGIGKSVGDRYSLLVPAARTRALGDARAGRRNTCCL